MHLATELPRMGWHEFSTLLRGLGPDSALHRNWQTLPRTGRAAANDFWLGVAAAGGNQTRKE